MDTTMAIVSLAIIGAVFMLCRELFTWYWKQNEVVKLLSENRDQQEDIKKLLDIIAFGNQPMPAMGSTAAPTPAKPKTRQVKIKKNASGETICSICRDKTERDDLKPYMDVMICPECHQVKAG